MELAQHDDVFSRTLSQLDKRATALFATNIAGQGRDETEVNRLISLSLSSLAAKNPELAKTYLCFISAENPVLLDLALKYFD